MHSLKPARLLRRGYQRRRRPPPGQSTSAWCCPAPWVGLCRRVARASAEFISISPLVGSGYRRVVGFNGVAGIAPVTVDNTASLLGQYDGGTVFTTAITVGAISKAATTWASGSAKACLNGGAVATSATLATGYGALTGLRYSLHGKCNGHGGHERLYAPRALLAARADQRRVAVGDDLTAAYF